MELVAILAGAVLPIVAIAGTGVVLGRLRDIDPGPLNTVAVYVLTPALVFHSLATTAFGGGTLVRLAAATGGVILATLAVAGVIAYGLGRRDGAIAALVLAASFPNAGNYGIPLSDFAFPDGGRAVAVVYVACEAILLYTVGVAVAAAAGGQRNWKAVRRVFTVPLVYAVPAALFARWLGVVPPADGTVMTTLGLVGDSAIPVMLLVLGVQLARTDAGGAVSAVGVPTLIKLVVAPAIAVPLALVAFRDPTVARVFVLESAMPAAVTPVVLVGEFADDASVHGVPLAGYVSTVVLVSTLVSIPTTTLLIALLQTGLVG